MFGYFRPYRSNLTQSELQLFNSYYCRVCYCLRLLGGQTARFFTTFDIAIYSMILNLQKGDADPPELKCQRFGKKNMKLFQEDETGLKMARMTFIAFGEKFRDDLLDSKSAKARLAVAFFFKTIERAKKAEPELARIGFEGTNRINDLQNAGAPLFDVLAAYGDMAVESFGSFMPLTAETAALVRYLSEWIFFIDMICDYDEDYGNNNAYNGFKTQGCPTFSDYFNLHYRKFLKIESVVTNRLVAALNAVKDDSRRWNTLFKIIMNAVDNVVPAVIEGMDVKFHYAEELRENYRKMRKTKRDSKRLGVHRE